MSSNLPPPLSAKLDVAKYPFIRETLTSRLPQILTKTMDRLVRVERETNSELDKDIKQAIHELQALRYGIHTNKPFGENLDKLWYEASWLEFECFFYQEIKRIVWSYDSLKHFDYFLESKQLVESINLPKIDETNIKDLLHMSLWANRKDLSLSAGEVDKSELDIAALSKNLLIDKTEQVLTVLKQSKSVAFVLDNCGWEFFSDIKLARYLCNNYGIEICFYPKQFPWFISDVTDNDVIRLSEKIDFKYNSKSNGFWTSDKAFFEMDDDLKNELSKFNAVVFKGDLNYRKLVGDLAWPVKDDDDLESVFSKLNFELDTNVIVLRTSKSEVCVGLKEVDLSKLESNWLIDGKYGVIDLVQCKNK